MKINKKKLTFKGIYFMTMSILLFSCSNEIPKDDAQTEIPLQDTIETLITEKADYALPSPLQIASMFKKAGMKYKDGITSQQKDPKIYMTNFSKTLNLGIYNADLSYALLNKKNQEAKEYIKLSRELAFDLGIGSAFDEINTLKRFEKNSHNLDSLVSLLSELQMEMEIYLNENNQQQITAIAFSGAWIESLYIASKVFDKTEEQELNRKFSQQMSILESIINALKFEEKKDPGITGLIADLKSIQDIYNTLPTVKTIPETDQKPQKKIELTKEDVASLMVKIEALRSKFIQGW